MKDKTLENVAQEAMERERSMRRRQLEKRLQKEGERGVEPVGPGYMTKEEKATIEEMMKMDKGVKGYKKGGMVTRGQGCVSRKKSCKMC